VKIADMQVLLTRDDVRVRCTVANAYSGELRKLAQSGTPILLYVFAEARQVRKDSLVSNAVAENKLELDLVAKQYRVTRSAGQDTVVSPNLDSALAATARCSGLAVLPKEKVQPATSYYFVVWAVLGKTRVEALANKEIDLMYFWRYNRPTLKTEPFKGEQFLASTK
jgi:hypothetical protein